MNTEWKPEDYPPAYREAFGQGRSNRSAVRAVAEFLRQQQARVTKVIVEPAVHGGSVVHVFEPPPGSTLSQVNFAEPNKVVGEYKGYFGRTMWELAGPDAQQKCRATLLGRNLHVPVVFREFRSR